MIQYAQLQQIRHELTTLTVSQSSPWDASAFPRGAPYKALLLLAVCDAVSRGRVPDALVVLDDWLLQRYTQYGLVCGAGVNDQPLIPFNYLRYESFWRLVPKAGQATALADYGDVRSQKAYTQLVAGAMLRDDLYGALGNTESRGLIRDCLIQTYFGVQLHGALWDMQGTDTPAR
jgi:hypothetical protein